MAVVSNVYKSLQFGGVNSADYGIYITGEAVYNAPERTVEFISVPGRNGSIALDKGRFENIEVTYPAGTFGDDQQDFREKLSDFRNAVLSQVGYQRLTDEYHPDEYRLGVYSSGLEVASTNKANGTAGEFSLTFNCKPQRFLTSGETEVTVASGGTITNPTPFDSQPLIAVKGKGTINLGDNEIEIFEKDLGTVTIQGAMSASNTGTTRLYCAGPRFANSLLNTGNIITVNGLNLLIGFTDQLPISSASFSSWSGISGVINNGNSRQCTASFPAFTLGYNNGPGNLPQVRTFSTTLSVYDAGGTAHDYSVSIRVEQNHYPQYNTISIELTVTSSGTDQGYISGKTVSLSLVTAYSTKSALGDPTYIDCEIGEAYKIEDGEIVSLNSSLDLGSDVPTLAAGENEITYDSTITEVVITPRWWKI